MSDEMNEQDELAIDFIDVDSAEVSADISEKMKKLRALYKELIDACEAQDLVAQLILIDADNRKVATYKMDFDFPTLDECMRANKDEMALSMLDEIDKIYSSLKVRMSLMIKMLKADQQAFIQIKQLKEYGDFKKALYESKEVTQAEEVVH